MYILGHKLKHAHNAIAHSYFVSFVYIFDYTHSHNLELYMLCFFSIQFWSAYMGCSTQGIDATRTFIDQIDVIKLLVKKYPDTFQFATSSSDIASALKSNRIASLVGIEGGHAIDSSLGTLRQLYDLGARYMTLTHTCNTPW